MTPLERIPESWRTVLAPEFEQPYMAELLAFLKAERAQHAVYPPPQDVFNALEYTPYDRVRVLVVGQDPYHGKGQAHGLAFSVRPGVRPPPSLENIFQELESDLGVPRPSHGCLEGWARQGVLLLNTSLTVRAGQAASHKGKGWEHFTDAVIRAVNAKTEPVIFVLWGKHAQEKQALIDATRHTVLKAPHPSPYSAASGFFGSRPFSKINAKLRGWGQPEIEWRLE
ncbi:MAG: uracil-DNA glycosylase [Meiothermus sp.]|nr:uracil-DNA glycosylase [Meiothermus sp.]